MSHKLRKSIYRSRVLTTDPNISKTEHAIKNPFCGNVDEYFPLVIFAFVTSDSEMGCSITMYDFRILK